MRTYHGGGLGRTIILNLERGEYLKESIMEALEKEGIKNAIVLSGIGSLDRAIFNRVDGYDEKLHVDYVTVEAPMELCSMQGVVVDGKPHFHIVISDLEQTYTGHLENETRILYLAEITLCELLDVNLTKVVNENGVGYFAEKN